MAFITEADSYADFVTAKDAYVAEIANSGSGSQASQDLELEMLYYARKCMREVGGFPEECFCL